MWLLLVTLLAGAGSAAAVAAGTPLADRTFAVISAPTQSLMSVAVPLLGILLISDARQRHGLSPIIPTLVAAVATGVAIGLLGFLFCLVATAVAASAAGPSRWSGVGMIALGSALVQVVPSLVGTGSGCCCGGGSSRSWPPSCFLWACGSSSALSTCCVPPRPGSSRTRRHGICSPAQ
jgi:hypothetical protein